MDEDPKNKEAGQQTLLPLAIEEEPDSSGVVALDRNWKILEGLRVSRDEIKQVMPDADTAEIENLFSLLRDKRDSVLPFILDESDSEPEEDDTPTTAAIESEDGNTEYFDIGRVYQEIDESVKQQMMNMMVQSVKSGTMAMPVFYFYPEMWEEVCSSRITISNEKDWIF